MSLLWLCLVQHWRKQASCHMDRHRHPLQRVGVSGYRRVDSQQGANTSTTLRDLIKRIKSRRQALKNVRRKDGS